MLSLNSLRIYTRPYCNVTMRFLILILCYKMPCGCAHSLTLCFLLLQKKRNGALRLLLNHIHIAVKYLKKKTAFVSSTEH